MEPLLLSGGTRGTCTVTPVNEMKLVDKLRPCITPKCYTRIAGGKLSANILCPAHGEPGILLSKNERR